METVVLQWWDLAVAGCLVGVGVACSALERAGLGLRFLLGGVRTAAQLVAVGFVLEWIFTQRGWSEVAAVVVGLTVMLVVASYTAWRGGRTPIPGGLPLFAIAITTATISTLAVVLLCVIRPEDPANPRYALVLGGMIVGNAMNGATLAADRLAGSLQSHRREVEAALALGAPARLAAQEAAREAFRAALIPTLNTMMTIGLVALPGMMTGQVTAGADPLQAVAYQILIVYMLAACVPLAVLLVNRLALRRFFTAAHQLRLPEGRRAR